MSSVESPAMITWLCFLGVSILTCTACFGYCCYIKRERRRHSDLNRDISRIEANVKVFAEQQDFRRKKSLHKCMAGQILVRFYLLLLRLFP